MSMNKTKKNASKTLSSQKGYKMMLPIRKPRCGDGVDHQINNLIKLHMYDTKTVQTLELLCGGCHLHTLMPMFGYGLVFIIRGLKMCGLNIIKEYNPRLRIWSGTGRPSRLFTYSLSERDIEIVQPLLDMNRGAMK